MQIEASNKTLDLGDLERSDYAEIVREIAALTATLTDKGLKFTTYQAEFNTGWGEGDLWLKRKLWEICTMVTHADLTIGQRILDCGGASTIFSFYLAAKGFSVDTADIDWRGYGIIENADTVAREMHWNMRNTKATISDLPYKDEQFDRIFSICVLEHLSRNDQARAIREMVRILKPGGILGLTFDYGPNAYDEKYRDVRDINSRIITPAGLKIRGNRDYEENPWFAEKTGKTWGALFLEKPLQPHKEKEFLFCSAPQNRFKVRLTRALQDLGKAVKDVLWSIGINRRNKLYLLAKNFLRR